MWDAYDMACLRILEEHRSDLVCMRFCESRNTLVTGHDNGTVRLWNLDTARYHTLNTPT
jgi:WD40 repeat protein